MSFKVLTVTSLNNYIKKILDNDVILSNIDVEGEISNFKKHTSGHLYFTLKDETSRVNCVMFKTDASKLKKLPVDGDKVTVKGRISSYVQGGNYQIYVNDIKSTGTGDLFLRFMEIKEKLEKEGLFSSEVKKRIPENPGKIAVITSPTGAAIRDIIKVTKNRNPSQELVIYPVQVQGAISEGEVLQALYNINQRDDIDVIIIARGGGSIEDLWSFNSEAMAYAIRRSKIPVVTGIGHDIDYTIADFAADLRGATPSQAAELTVPSIIEYFDRISQIRNTLRRNINEKIRTEKNHLSLMQRMIMQNDPKLLILNESKNVSDIKERLNFRINNILDKEQRRLDAARNLLAAYNPMNVLSKGYAIVEDTDGKLIDDVNVLEDKNIIKITLKNGNRLFKGGVLHES
ncbi:MAG: exodeoxyribonuclease VII large subunit [Clostridiaceae bacterium]